MPPSPHSISPTTIDRTLRLGGPSSLVIGRIYTYQAPWVVFGLAWSQRQEERNRFRLALGSFIEEYTNKVQIVQRNNESGSLERVGEFGTCGRS